MKSRIGEAKSNRRYERHLSSMGAVRVLLLDLGGVLIVDPQPVVVRGIERYESRRVPALLGRYRALSRQLDASRITLRQMHTSLARELGLTIPFARFAQLVTWESLILHERVLSAVGSAQQKARVRVRILSNTSPSVWGGRPESLA
jgi:hypothetical protein